VINNNDIKGSKYGISLQGGASNNVIESNRIVNTSYTAIQIDDEDTNKNIKNNILLNNQKKMLT